MKVLAEYKVNNEPCNMIYAYKDMYGNACAVVVFSTGATEEVLLKDLIILDDNYIPKKENK